MKTIYREMKKKIDRWTDEEDIDEAGCVKPFKQMRIVHERLNPKI